MRGALDRDGRGARSADRRQGAFTLTLTLTPTLARSYQYPITRERNPLARPLWFANFALRTFVLSKLLAALFSPAAIVLVLRPQLSYTEVWALAARTTRRLQAAALVSAAAAIGAFVLRRALMA